LLTVINPGVYRAGFERSLSLSLSLSVRMKAATTPLEEKGHSQSEPRGEALPCPLITSITISPEIHFKSFPGAHSRSLIVLELSFIKQCAERTLC